ncbi:probable serine/threonine-protein kinase At1g54610 [Phragmites australis]|uniref:probable serine/threonine-protein kinase At1g54610 n=1 Tax=Phragmites australis TaxID=29695 RepID=UPI002D787AA0|nr:probable serine/threonine-protein kinase At1g54610 [Phragmites australis]
MGCVHGRPSASTPDRPPPPTQPEPSAAAQEVAATAGKAEQPAPLAEKPPRRERRSRSSRPAPGPGGGSFANRARGEQVAAGWPAWLSAVAGEAIDGWTPRRADSFEKIDKIGQGTYSNVYKARDTVSGKIVALKKVRFDNLEPESVRFMAREILILRRLDHPNVVKLDGLVTSRMSCSLYLVFEYMEHDLAGLAASPDIKFTEPQVKCYMHQLLSGLEHCHDRGVLHRDVKGSNLLLDNNGMLKIADFGLASFFDPDRKQPLTSRVVTLWYRPPELLLGATDYGVGVDLWSAGCILAELLSGRPIMPGRTEVEQLHKIFKLCGSPTEEYWKKSKLPHTTIFKPQQPYKRRIRETFKDFPQSALQLIETLLAIDPADRLTATSALKSHFFTTEPYACEPSSLPKYPPSKEIDAKRRDEEARRLRAAGGRANGDGAKKTRTRDRPNAVPAPEANAELQVNIDKRRLITHATAKSKSEKFPPPHQDGTVGVPLDSSNHMDPLYEPRDPSSFSTVFAYEKGAVPTWSGPLVDPSAIANQKRKHKPGRLSKQPATARAR